MAAFESNIWTVMAAVFIYSGDIVCPVCLCVYVCPIIQYICPSIHISILNHGNYFAYGHLIRLTPFISV